MVEMRLKPGTPTESSTPTGVGEQESYQLNISPLKFSMLTLDNLHKNLTGNHFSWYEKTLWEMNNVRPLGSRMPPTPAGAQRQINMN